MELVLRKAKYLKLKLYIVRGPCRDKKASKEEGEAEEEIDIDLDDPEVEAAAVKIQAGFKNYKSRQATKAAEEPVSNKVNLRGFFP